MRGPSRAGSALLRVRGEPRAGGDGGGGWGGAPTPPPQARPGRRVLAPDPRGPDQGGAPVISPVRWAGDRLVLLDQTRLPTEEGERQYTSWSEVAAAIRSLVVRGAPAIGVTAAFGVALAARESRATTFDGLEADVEAAIKGLAPTRPTAVNLFWALERMRRCCLGHRALPLDALRARLVQEAQAVLDEDVAANRAMGPPRAGPGPDRGRG